MGRRLVAIGLGAVAVLAWKASRGEIAPTEPTRLVAHRDARSLTRLIDHVVEPPTIEIEPDEDVGDVEDVEPEEVDDGDGLTDEQRWEGQVAIVEDTLPAGRGALHGAITDASNGERMAGVTVVATGPNLEGAQTAITDEQGYYAITALPPGEYVLTFYYLETTIERSGLFVGPDRATPVFQRILQQPTEPIVITLDEDIEDVEVINPYQVSFTGTESMDNTYVVDGIDTTGLTFGDDE